MASAFRQFEQLVKGLNRLFALLASVFVLVVVVVVIASIAARMFGTSLLWANDVAQIAFVYLVFLAMAPALESGHHIAVELFEPLVPVPVRKLLDHIAALACIIFGLVFLAQLWKLTARSFSEGRLAISAITIQLKWIQVVGPIGLAQFVLTAVVNLGAAHRRLLRSDRSDAETP